ncbi:hypothetical protein B296_00026804 [Ensete ventricosum]|uniref:Uncharacterized protein n=1 Tax=Ensete ventricosum TaxID=4639 RepID=A0A426Z436_ENSVE|nr:hypothetical protein B296_00026804 [Ensete ventricosum]
MQFLRRIQELHNQRNLVPSLKELHSKELIGEHVSDQLGHPEVTRTKISQHLIPLHPLRDNKAAPFPSPSLLPLRRRREEERDEIHERRPGESGVGERNASVAVFVGSGAARLLKYSSLLLHAECSARPSRLRIEWEARERLTGPTREHARSALDRTSGSSFSGSVEGSVGLVKVGGCTDPYDDQVSASTEMVLRVSPWLDGVEITVMVGTTEESAYEEMLEAMEKVTGDHGGARPPIGRLQERRRHHPRPESSPS